MRQFEPQAARAWLPPHFDGMLPELMAVPNWVLADHRKIPIQPNRRPASVNDQRTWSPFVDAQAHYCPARHIGIGFVLDGKPHFAGHYLHGFDWDHCIVGGEIDPAVKAAVKALNIARLEVSVSGTGLRGFFLHSTRLPSRKVTIEGRSVELYSNGRYLITTGLAFPGCEQLM